MWSSCVRRTTRAAGSNPRRQCEPSSVERGHVVIDEAYAPFAGTSVIPTLGVHENLIVVRTFSKAWALAGLRLGYAVARPEVVRTLFDVALPYHLDQFKQAAAIAALRHEGALHDRTARIVRERDRVAEALRRLDVETVPSDANFLLIRLGDRNADVIWHRLVDRSVLVRNVSSWRGLSGCLRVTIGLRQENDAFLAALEASLSDASVPVYAKEPAK